MPDEPVRHYALYINGPFGDKKLDLSARKRSCKTCGHPFIQAGVMCPPCADAFGGDVKAMMDVFQRHHESASRMVHVYGVGHVDPWTPAGKALLGD